MSQRTTPAADSISSSVPPGRPAVRSRPKVPISVFKLAVFTVVTVALIGLLGTLIGNVSFVPSRTYYALFSDATGVFEGDRVRLSGVEVGSVTSLELRDEGDGKVAKVGFTVEDTVPVFESARLKLRFENIVGQRYLAIEEEADGGAAMSEGATFPLSQTEPALNLTDLFNGFQPLFRALDPETVNTFTFELVRALQGEAGTLQGLFRDTATLTDTLADKDQVIGEVVTNLNQVLTTVGSRDEQLTDLIVSFRDLMDGLADDSGTIGASLPSLEGLLTSTTGLLRDVRAPLRSNVESLNTLAGDLDRQRETLEESLKRTPEKLRVLARTGSYGSWFNFYVCGLDIRLSLLDGTVNLGGAGVSANERDTVCAGGTEQ